MTEQERIAEQDENTLVELYMKRMGWAWPDPQGYTDIADYNESVSVVKFFMAQMAKLGYRRPEPDGDMKVC